MNKKADDGKNLSPLKRALLAVEEMKSRLKALQSERTEPIAVVGIGLRFPGAKTVDEFWELLEQGVDAIREVPPDRWDVDEFYDPNPQTPGKMITRWGGFIEDVDQFDPQFFGISPREATRMDPQQRLLLEATWEALEDAGINPRSLAKSKTGVFVGISSNDYSRIQGNDLRKVDPYTGTGNAFSIAANRISYTFDFQGPSVAVDTACSSSLVSIHLACLSLRNKESDVAVAGGVNLILSPELSITFSQAGMLAPGGRCRTFDASAEGYVRGEGVGMVVLKRLSDALKDGDRILAVIRGSAVNQDGKSNGLTAPNSLAQQRVIRQALKNAGVKPEEVGYVEAHGTGTILGDPIEVQALGMVMKNRPVENTCYLGSVKTNIGHLESAAGVAGFIKAVLAVHKGKIPPHLHFKQINPHIPIQELPFEIPTRLTDWPSHLKKRIAGVSSFGFGGTNAHIVLEAPPPVERRENAVERTHHLLTLAANEKAALQQLADRYAAFLKTHPEASLGDVCFTANTGRAPLPVRAAVVGKDSREMVDYLTALAKGEEHFAVQEGEADVAAHPKIAFLFTGQGAQSPGMGQELYRTFPSFKKTLDEINTLTAQYLDHPLLEVLFAEDELKERIHQTQYTQPALFAIEYALAKFWMDLGIEPDYLIGHSIGEITAACIAGVMSLEDTVKLVCARGRLMQELPQNGTMAALFAPAERVKELLKDFKDTVSIAGLNGPENTVISGEKGAVQAVLEAAAAQNIEFRELKVSHAFHSALMEPMLDKFEAVAGEITYHPPKIPIVSNLTGKLLAKGEVPDARYWRNHIRQAVQFYPGMQTLAELGVTVFIETGPHPVLIGMGRKSVPQVDGVWVPSLKRDQSDWHMLLTGVGTLFVRGVPVNLARLDADYHRYKLSLPTYPFQRQRYWVEWAQPGGGGSVRRGRLEHPLLGYRLPNPLPVAQFENEADDVFRRQAGVSNLKGTPLLPFGVFVELMQLAAQRLDYATNTLTDIEFHSPLVVDKTVAFQTIAQKQREESTVSVFRRLDAEGTAWETLAAASWGSDSESVSPVDVNAMVQQGTPVAAGDWYRQLEARGMRWDAPLVVLDTVFQYDGKIAGKLRVAEASSASGRVAAWEAALQLLPGLVQGPAEEPVVIRSIHRWTVLSREAQPAWCVVAPENLGKGPEPPQFAIQWLDETGTVVAVASGVHVSELPEAWQARLKDAGEVTEAVAEEKSRATGEETVSLEQLRSASPEERQTLLTNVFRQHLAQVLKLSPGRIDPRQPITNLGLDSILAIELKNNLEQALNIELPVAALIEGPSIEELAQRIAEQLGGEAAEQIPTLTVSEQTEGDFPLSYGQKAMWFQHQMAPKSIFNPAYAARVRAPIDIPRLKAAFQEVVNRHAMLRTTFHLQNGEPVQRVRGHAEVFFREVDARGMSDAELLETLQKEALQPYNLETGPLFRVHVYSRGKNDHVILMAAHHIVVDMWSQAVITSEVNELYNKNSELPPVTFQYMDFVRWQSELLSGERGEQLFEYWKNELAGELPILDLPTDRPRPAVQTFDGKMKTVTLGKALTEQLHRVSEAHGVTLYMTLLAAFQTFLARYSGQKDIIVGTPTTGRSLPELTNIVGYFVNPLPIRTDFTGNPRFSDILQQVRQKVVGALKHQDYPLNLIVEKLQPQRDPSRTPIFQVMFVYQRAHLLAEQGLSEFAVGGPGTRLELEGLPLEAIPLQDQVAPFDITLMMAEGQQGLSASLTYNVDLFDESTVERMLAHFRNLLEGIAAGAEQPVTELPLLSDEEVHTMIHGWNDTAGELPEFATALDVLERTAAQFADKPAVVFQNQQITYAELHQRANRLAHYLMEQGVGPETVVGISTVRSPDMIVAILGVLKAGGAYLPLDPDYPPERLKYLIEDSGARLIIVHQKTRKRLPETGVPLVDLDELADALAAYPPEAPRVTVDSRNLAYMIYTSGSTGKPKGVQVEHQSFVANLFSMDRAFGVDEQSRVLQFASFSFDAAVEEIFSALFSGGTLVLVPQEVLLSGPALLEEMRRHRVTHVTLPPSVSRVLPTADLPDLKTVISAGESCTPEVVERWKSVPVLINAYGPTETTVCATTFRVPKDFDRVNIPIGTPITNVRVYILDEALNPVPVGVAGELYIGGHGVARGYHHRPELTAERFLPDPFSEVPGARMYRTGDLARYRPDGTIEFLGRVDFQVKIRGFRIELGEIETVLREHPRVQEAVVIARQTPGGDPRLVGYVVPETKDAVDAASLRAYLKERLPDYMVPATFVMLETMPLTPNGKIDRKRLPAPEAVKKERPEFVQPDSGIERQVADLWKEILQVDTVGLNDNFFDLGGHSLNVIQLQTRVKEVFDREIAVVDLFKYPTVSAFARFLSEGHEEKQVTAQARERVAKQRSALNIQRARMRKRRQS